MVDLEEGCLSLLDFQPVCYYRYVDDSFAIIPTSKIKHMLDVFNAADARMKCTYEVETNRTLNFLELKIEYSKGRTSFDWHHKPTFSGRVLNFYSNHPISQTIAMVYNLVDIAFFLTDKIYHRKYFHFAKSILLANSYPEKFVEKYVKKRIAMNINKSRNVDNNVNISVQTDSPHRPNMYLKILYNRHLHQTLSHYLKEFDVGTVATLGNNFWKFIRREIGLNRNIR